MEISCLVWGFEDDFIPTVIALPYGLDSINLHILNLHETSLLDRVGRGEVNYRPWDRWCGNKHEHDQEYSKDKVADSAFYKSAQQNKNGVGVRAQHGHYVKWEPKKTKQTTSSNRHNTDIVIYGKSGEENLTNEETMDMVNPLNVFVPEDTELGEKDSNGLGANWASLFKNGRTLISGPNYSANKEKSRLLLHRNTDKEFRPRIRPKTREAFHEGTIVKWEKNLEDKPLTARKRPCSLSAELDWENSSTTSNGSFPMKVYSREKIKSKVDGRLDLFHVNDMHKAEDRILLDNELPINSSGDESSSEGEDTIFSEEDKAAA
ncbi:hypothetical protein TorRG33x02_338890 [Trema orientale]|uniref:Uncharacterized protein n=1 Tax=Trema orientale TaxID=63057 RepID=A0A2P5AX04_TREOI|nr:hypothetical protein TorRG33x02_338890 [Trema orientale]